MEVKFKFEKFQGFWFHWVSKFALSHWLCTWALPQCIATALPVILMMIIKHIFARQMQLNLRRRQSLGRQH